MRCRQVPVSLLHLRHAEPKFSPKGAPTAGLAPPAGSESSIPRSMTTRVAGKGDLVGQACTSPQASLREGSWNGLRFSSSKRCWPLHRQLPRAFPIGWSWTWSQLLTERWVPCGTARVSAVAGVGSCEGGHVSRLAMASPAPVQSAGSLLRHEQEPQQRGMETAHLPALSHPENRTSLYCRRGRNPSLGRTYTPQSNTKPLITLHC